MNTRTQDTVSEAFQFAQHLIRFLFLGSLETGFEVLQLPFYFIQLWR